MVGDDHGTQRLDSWKEIAAYLRRDGRTAIRWEKTRDLPVHRVPGGKRKAVFAFTNELDDWLTREERGSQSASGYRRTADRSAKVTLAETSHPIVSSDDLDLHTEALQVEDASCGEKRFTLTLRSLALWATIIGATTFAILAFRSSVFAHRPPSSMVRLGFSANAVEAFDGKGKLIWTHGFSGSLEPSALSRQRTLTDVSFIGDFRGNGGKEAIVSAPIRMGFNSPEQYQLETDFFSGTGQLLWSYVPHGSFEFGKYRLDGPWAFGDIFVSHIGKPQIWAAFLQSVWGNSYVVNLDPASGKDILRYVNTGTIRALNEIRVGQKTFLLVGGFNNEEDRGSLAIVEESRAFATSPQTPGSRHECTDCPPGQSDFYFVFPRSEINEIQAIHENSITQIFVNGNQIEAVKGGVDQEDVTRVHYLINAADGFHLSAIRFNSEYDSTHRRFEREGKLQHSLEKCPERLNPRPVQLWTPKAGWANVALPPTPFNQ